MYTAENNMAKFNLEEESLDGNIFAITGRVYHLHDFSMKGVCFQVAHTIFPLKFYLSASRNGKKLSDMLDLNQINEYLLTGEENDFFREYNS